MKTVEIVYVIAIYFGKYRFTNFTLTKNLHTILKKTSPVDAFN